MGFLSMLLDIALIGLLIAGIHYAIKLTRQLAEMRAGRMEMQQFILDFNATVTRAEAGVRGLKNTARSSGDDLEKLIEKGQILRDELHFLTESAEHLANRLSHSASATRTPAAQPAKLAQPKPQQAAPQPKPTPQAAVQSALQELQNIASGSTKVSSSAERDLLRALEKLG